MVAYPYHGAIAVRHRSCLEFGRDMHPDLFDGRGSARALAEWDRCAVCGKPIKTDETVRGPGFVHGACALANRRNAGKESK